MKNIHLIPTDKPSRLHNKNGELGNYPSTKLYIEDFKGNQHNSFHIYITSDEDLVLGGYHFNSKYGDEPQKTNQRDIDSRKYWEEEDYYITKIILTTDQDLIKDGVQSIDDEFLEWFIKNPSCEWVEVLTDAYTMQEIFELKLQNGVFKYKIIIPQEESKQEKLEEAAENHQKNVIGIALPKHTFIAGAKWQQQNNYSEEEAGELVYNVMGEYAKRENIFFKGDLINNLFNKLKKK